MIRRVTNLLSSIDFLSPQIGFEFQGSSQYKSVSGGFYSGVIVIITIFITTMFSIDLFSRSSPIVFTYMNTVNSSTINLMNYPISLTLYDDKYINPKYLKYLDMKLTYIEISSDYIPKQTVITDFLEVCDMNKYILPSEELKEDYAFTKIPGVYCIKALNLTISNKYHAPDSSYIKMEINQCDPKSDKNCPIDVEEQVNKLYVTISYITSFTNSQNNQKPITHIISDLAVKINTGLSSRIRFDIINNQYISDEGWIFSSEVSYNHYSSHETVNQLLLDLNNKSRSLLNFSFHSSKVSLVSKRSYTKIQDFLSNIGGFSSIFFVILKYLTKHHLRFNYLAFIRSLALEDKTRSSNKEDKKLKLIKTDQNRSKVEIRQEDKSENKIDDNQKKQDDSPMKKNNFFSSLTINVRYIVLYCILEKQNSRVSS